MMNLTGIEQKELNRNMIPLIDLQILKCQSSNNQSFYTVNNEFEHKNYKIKVPVLKNKHKKIEIGENQKDITILERKMNLEIYIIRTMKRMKEVFNIINN